MTAVSSTRPPVLPSTVAPLWLVLRSTRNDRAFRSRGDAEYSAVLCVFLPQVLRLGGIE